MRVPPGALRTPMWGQGAGRHRLAGSYLPLQPESGGLSGCGKQGELGNSHAPNQLHEEQVGSAPGSEHLPARGAPDCSCSCLSAPLEGLPDLLPPACGTFRGGDRRSLDAGRSPRKWGDPAASPEAQWSIQQASLEHPQCEVPDAAGNEGYMGNKLTQSRRGGVHRNI